MKWIIVLVYKKTDKEPQKNDEVEVFSQRDRAIGLLEDWLALEFWNFDLGRNQFDGHSEGLCILAGIDPEHSTMTSTEYGPVFLPKSKDAYGIDRITPQNKGGLKEAIDNHVDDLKSLGLKGRVHCHEAIRTSVEKKLPPFWLEAARDDTSCAGYLPEEAETTKLLQPEDVFGNASISEKDPPLTRYQASATKKANSRWENDDNKNLRIGFGADTLEDLLREKFSSCRKGNGKVKLALIAREVLQRMSKFVGEDEVLPVERTIIKDVKKFLSDRELDISSL